MNLRTVLLCAGLWLSYQAFASAAVTIEWVNPTKFIDIQGDSMRSEKGKQYVLNELERYIKIMVAKRLPGYDLDLKVTNVDLEGNYEPWHGPNESRVIRDVYPARMEFSYVLRQPDGKVAKEGGESLSSIGADRPFFADEEFAYTKQMIDEWLRDIERGLVVMNKQETVEAKKDTK